MERTIELFSDQIHELRWALPLECTEDDAKQYGTLKEWKRIDRHISSLEFKLFRTRKRFKNISKDLYDIQDDLRFWLVALALFFVTLTIRFGVICLAVFLFTLSIEIPFSPLLASSIWLIYELFKAAISKYTAKNK